MSNSEKILEAALAAARSGHQAAILLAKAASITAKAFPGREPASVLAITATELFEFGVAGMSVADQQEALACYEKIEAEIAPVEKWESDSTPEEIATFAASIEADHDARTARLRNSDSGGSWDDGAGFRRNI